MNLEKCKNDCFLNMVIISVSSSVGERKGEGGTEGRRREGENPFLKDRGAMVLGVGLLSYWEEKDEKKSDI